MAKKIVVDYDECEANAVCVGHAPDFFELDDDDNLWLLQETAPDDALDRVQSAVAGCPKRALSLVDVDDAADG